MNTKEVLIAARKLIDTPEKWCKAEGRWRNARCAVVALSHAAGDRDWSSAGDALRRVIDPKSDPEDVSVAMWNDAPERTHAEVLAAFDKAIAGCDQ